MARRRPPAEAEHDPDQDVYILQEEDGEPEPDDEATIIETQVVMDWIEYNIDEDDDEEEPSPAKPGNCRLTFHVDLPEHIAQHLFTHHVKNGLLTVEFQPTSPALRRRDAIVRS